MSNILALILEEALGDIPIGLMAMKASLTLALADFEPASARIRPSNNNLTVEGMKTLTESKQRQASVLLVEDEALIRMMIDPA